MNASHGEPSQSALADSGLEVRSRRVLEAGLSRIDARTRSRLNQARQAAVAEAAKGSGLSWLYRPFTRHALMPAGAAAAAALIAVFMLSGGGHHLTQSPADTPASALDVLDLVTDDDAMKLMEDNNDGSFYEWAAAQGENAGAASGQGSGGAPT
jgi:hypothetical protein